MHHTVPALALAALLSARIAAAQPAPSELPSEVRAALSRPSTAAATALLLPHTAHRPVVERLALALRDPTPEVRAMAARVAFTTRQAALLPALSAALDTEAETVPATEMARALALIGGSAADDAVFKAMARTGKSVGQAWVGVVARTRPVDLLPRLPVLGGSADRAVAHLVESDAAVAAAVFAPLPTTPALEASYHAVLEQFDRDVSRPVPWSTLAIGLKASRDIRRTVVRLLLHRRAAGVALPAEAEAVLADLRAPAATVEDPYLAMTFELLRRREMPGEPAVPVAAFIAALDSDSFPATSWRDGWLRRLVPAEDAALRARVRLMPREQLAPETGRSALAPAGPPSDMVVRMVRPLTPRLVTELGELTGCRPARDQLIAVQFAFRPGGQVRQVLNPVGIGAERCAAAARILGALDMDDGQTPIAPQRTDLVLIGFRPEDAKCPGVGLAQVGNELRLGTGNLRGPRKLRHVPPVYPQEMQDLRIQGVVLIEATVAPTGCVTEAAVLDGPHATMKAAALAAVSLWQYEPSLLDGKPVPIIMTVTVNFSLQ